VSDANGYVYVSKFPNIADSDIRITADGFNVLGPQHLTPADLVKTNDAGQHNFFTLTPAHVDPSAFRSSSSRRSAAAMWPLTDGACGNLPLGPRPPADNVIATVFITDYSAAEQDCIIGELKRRGYTHVVMGPLVDSDGYHGIWQPNDWRGANFDRFLDAVQLFWDNGLAPVVFIHPDNWSFEQTRDELTPLLQQPRAQRLIRIAVPSGWEPRSTAGRRARGRRTRSGPSTLPNALSLLHTVTDVDAPVGTDARCDDNGKPNARRLGASCRSFTAG
jgi:hypothetical protein